MSGAGNRHYRNAASQERRVKERLAEVGWTCWRTPGSKSPADLVCLRAGYPPLLVQCKNGESVKMSGPAKARFAAYAAQLGATAVLVEKGMRFTQLTEEAA